MGSLRQFYNTRVEDLSFRIYTEEEIEKISAIHVTKDESFNNLGHYVDNGIYDLHMGPMSQRDNDLCKTCGNTFFTCIGHCGHINLPLPVFNPFFYDILKDVLQRICPACFRFNTKEKIAIRFIFECKFLFAGYDQEALEVESFVREIISDPMEALEDTMHVDESINPSSCGIAEIRNLTTALHKIFEQTKKTKVPFQSPTCNSQSVYTKLRTKFLMESKKNNKGCVYCKRKHLKLKYQNSKIMITETRRTIVKDASKDSISESQPFLTAEQTRTMLRKCFAQDGEIFKSLYPILASIKVDKTNKDKAQPTDMFFIQKLLVIPPKHRPCNKINEKLIENDMSVLYKYILQQSKCLRFVIKTQINGVEKIPESMAFLLKELGGKTNDEKIFTLWCQLQGFVDNILDSELNSINQIAKRGVRQLFEKKFGVIRRHLMGKRSDYSGRSVAAPDPWLAVDQVGVPIEFALKLTYPVPVTPWNVSYLRKLVLNGPLNFPGALFVEDEQGRKVTLKAEDYKQRNALAQGLLTPSESCVKNVNLSKIVYRHLQNGDYVLMNRQPTLHKPSIQAHKARIMPKDRVLRLPYASCKAYNADFDGDELNLHFPQNETARSESKYIITTRNQYLTPKDGAPLSGLIQDCVVASVKLTMRGKFFNLGDYQELVFVALSHLPHKIRLLPPTILKPQRLWSGKQIISTILLNLISERKSLPSFIFKTTVKDDMWQTQPKRLWNSGQPPDNRKLFMSESEFIMREGELVSGIVDKCAIGSTSYGLVHVCYDLYGGEVASQVLTSINRLCVFYLQWAGHTISLKEFVTPKDASLKRREELKSLIQRTKYEVSNKLRIHEDDLEDHIEVIHKSENEKEMSVIDAAYTSSLGPTTSTIIRENEQNLYRSNLQNNMRMMIDTGSKGSRVNMNQMASLFGSVAIDGKRMPISVTGKSLPSFKSYECDPRSGGYIPTRFVTGMDPRSYFFLCIVGRDSLQHTAVKTANSGYMQRCLIKHLEGISVKYDNTVRNSDGVVLQFEYGEDGLDVTKVPFLRSIDTIDSILQSEKICLKVVPEIEKHKKTIKKCKSEFSDGRRVGGFLKFSSKAKENSELDEILTSPERIEKLISSWRSLYSHEKEALRSKNLKHTEVGHSVRNEVLMGLWYAKSAEEKLKFSKLEKLKRKNVTVASKFFGTSQCQFGVVSEALDDLIDQYYDERYSKRRVVEQPLTVKEVRETLHMKALKSKVDPGEAVGALCAQAIGEPLTQMTLNTFHFAGRDELNVTLGVPRMIEILRTASPNINTPIMEIPFKDGVPKSIAEKLKRKLTPVSLMMMVSEIKVTSSLESLPKFYRRAVVRFSLHPYEIYKKVYYVKPYEVLRFMEKSYFKKILLKNIHDTIAKVSSYASTSRKKDDDNIEEATVTRGLEEADSDEEENKDEEQAKEDGVSGADKQGTTKEKDFSDDEEEELENDENSDDEVEASRVEVKQERDIDNPDSGIDNPDSGDDMEQKFDPNQRSIKEFLSDKKKSSTTPKSQKKNKSINIYLMRKNEVIAGEPWIVNYEFDEESSLWCEITLELPIAEGRYDLVSILKKTSEESFVHQMPGIKKVYVVEKDGRFLLRSEGVNIKEIYTDKDALAYLDINRFYTNNIHFMAQKYGIEAAQRCVIKEIREVQSAYDITVDFRHLSLLSDYFTCEGVYKACSRMALDTCASMIQKMSFETCFAFMKKSLLQGSSDSMYSPSASVMVGQPVKLGTNSMGIIMNGQLL